MTIKKFYIFILLSSIFTCMPLVKVKNIEIINLIIQPTKFTCTISWSTNVCTKNSIYVNENAYTSEGTTHSITILGLNFNTNYLFTIDSEVCDTEKKYYNSTNYNGNFNTDFATTVSISSITESNKTCDSITITCNTDIASNCTIYYGLSTSYGNSLNVSTTDNLNHSIILPSLNSNTIYYYKIVAIPIIAGYITNQSTDKIFNTNSINDIIIGNIVVSNISGVSAIITWATNNISTCSIDYGLTTSYGLSSASITSDNLNHSVTLTGLNVSTLYNFRVNATSLNSCKTDNQSINNSFVTTIGTLVTISNIVFNNNPPSGSLILSWQTDVQSNCSIDYGLTSSYGSTKNSTTTDHFTHNVTITGLAIGNIYHYKINANPTVAGYSSNSTEDATKTTRYQALFNIIAYGGNNFLCSTDGITWGGISIPASEYWIDIACSNRYVVAIAYARMNVDTATTQSPDVNWTTTNYLGCHNWNSLCWGNSFFCAVANQTYTATTTDGYSWTLHTLPVSASWYSIAWNGTVFCTIANNSSICLISSDGVNWAQQALPISTSWTNIIWAGNKFFATSDTTISAYSVDGITWVQSSTPEVFSRVVCYNGSIFVGMSSGSGYGYTSTDGITWNQVTLPKSAAWTHIAWNSYLSLFCVIVSNSTDYLTSPDGTNWTLRALPISAIWKKISARN